MVLDKPRYDYELYICKDDGDQYLSGQSMGDGRRTFLAATHVMSELCVKEGRSRMLRLFGPMGDGKWGFLEARICWADGTVTEHMSVTVPEPFFSGKKPAPPADDDPVHKLSVEQLRSIVESVRDILCRNEDGELSPNLEWDSDTLGAIDNVFEASGLCPADEEG